MNYTRRKLLTGSAAATAAGMSAPAVLRAQEVTRWQAQCFWSASELTYELFEGFCARVKELTGGRLEIEPFSGGAVVGVFESLDAVSSGLLQAHSSWPGYFTGKEPGFAVISDFVFAYDDPWQAAVWYYERGGLDLLREMYAEYNLHTVGVSWWGVESIVAKDPIRNMEEFGGVKIRSPQGMTAEILTKLGASIVVLPGGEVYSALDKGVIDASDWATTSMNHRMGFFEVAKNSVKLFHSMPVQDFSVNMEAWNALSDELKAILTAAVHEWGWKQIRAVANADASIGTELREKDITEITWDESELAKMRDLARQTWKEWSGKSDFAKRAYDSQIAWLEELGTFE